MSDVHATLRERLNEALDRHPDHIKVIAERAGYNREYVASLAGRRKGRTFSPTIGAVWAIAGALGVDPLWLLGK
jgi:transcriptional regulator with XRE-family HTH domain